MSEWKWWPAIWNWMGLGGPRVSNGLQSGLPGYYPAPPPIQVTFETAMQESAWWACVRLLVETCSTLPVRMYRDQRPASVEEFDHPLIRLLKFKPNQYQTRIEFFENLFLNLVVHGNAYARVFRNSAGEVISLIPIQAQQMTVTLEQGVLTYQWTDGANVAVYAQDSILHVKLFGNGVIGLSPLAYAASSIGIAVAERRAAANVWRKGLRPSGILMVDNKLDKAQRDAIREQFRGLVEENEGNELIVLDRFMKFEATSMTPQDADFLASRRFSVQDIARFMGVNSVLINDNSQSTSWGSGIEQLMEGAYKLTFRPLLERVELALAVALLSLEDRWQYTLEFDFDAVGRMNMLARSQAFREQINSGQITPNEARAMEGREPMPGGNVLFIQGATVPINEAGASPTLRRVQ